MKQSKFQFINPYLEDVYFSANPELDSVNSDMEIENSFRVQVKRNKEENRALVELRLETNEGKENAPFTLRIQVASEFKWEGLDEETVDSMLRLNAPSLLLGYMRPIVASLTNASIFPVYNLPFMNFKE